MTLLVKAHSMGAGVDVLKGVCMKFAVSTFKTSLVEEVFESLPSSLASVNIRRESR